MIAFQMGGVRVHEDGSAVAGGDDVMLDDRGQGTGTQAIRRRLLAARYQADAAARDLSGVDKQGAAGGARVMSVLMELRAEVQRLAPAVQALGAGEKEALRPVTSALLGAAWTLARKEARQKVVYDALLADVTGLFGVTITLADKEGAGDAERPALIAAELAGASAALLAELEGGAEAGGAAPRRHLGVARQLLLETPPTAVAAFKPAIEELSEHARKLAERATHDGVRELMILVSDVRGLVGLARERHEKMPELVSAQNARPRFTPAQQGRHDAAASDLRKQLALLYKHRENSVGLVRDEAGETDHPPPNSIWKTLAEMALTLAGAKILEVALGVVATSAANLATVGSAAQIKKQTAAVAAQRRHEDVFGATEVEAWSGLRLGAHGAVKDILDFGVEKGVPKIMENRAGDARPGAGAASPDQAGDVLTTAPKAMYFKTQLDALAEEGGAAGSRADKLLGASVAQFAQAPEETCVELEHAAGAIASSIKTADAEQTQRTRMGYVAMFAQAAQGTVKGNHAIRRAEREAEEKKGVLGISVKLNRPDPEATETRAGTDLGEATKLTANVDALGEIKYATEGAGVISLQLQAGPEPTDAVWVVKAWLKGLNKHVRARLEETPLLATNIPIRAHAALGGGTVVFARNERGSIWAETQGALGGPDAWCQAKAGGPRGRVTSRPEEIRERAARKVLEEEIGPRTLLSYLVKLEG